MRDDRTQQPDQHGTKSNRAASLTRTIDAPRALFAGLASFGYVYVGRLALAVMLLRALLASLATVAWSRLILNATVAYCLAGAGLALGLLQIIHPVVIAAQKKQAPRKSYNRVWFYALWIVLCVLIVSVLPLYRGTVFGYETSDGLLQTGPFDGTDFRATSGLKATSNLSAPGRARIFCAYFHGL